MKRLYSCLLVILLLGCSEFKPADPCESQGCSILGEVQCDNDRAVICKEHSDGCLALTPGPQCQSGERCAGPGICGIDDCPTLGELRCVESSGVEECTQDQYGFHIWGPVTSCAAGNTCSAGTCHPPGCTKPGDRQCVQDGKSFVLCEVYETELRWSAPAPCPGDLACAGEGQCGKNECDSAGASQCTSDDPPLVQKCELTSSGFLKLSEPAPCESGLTCGRQGSCGVHQCGPKGVVRCADSGTATQVCEPGSNAFLTWSAPIECGDQKTCAGDGVCGSHACPTLEELQCENSAEFRVCIEDENGFRMWSDSKPCVENTMCVNNQCTPVECPSAGVKKCVDFSSNQFRICEASDDGLLVWGEPIFCKTEGSVCKGEGVCGNDECPVAGYAICVNDNSATMTCEVMPNQFLDYGAPVQCGENQHCIGTGLCVLAIEGILWDSPTENRPHLTALPGGGFAATWAGLPEDGNKVLMRRYSKYGQPIEDAQTVSDALGTIAPADPTIASLPTLGFSAVALSWLDASGKAIRLLSASGAKAQYVDEFWLPMSASSPSPQPYIVRLTPSAVGVAQVEGFSDQKITIATWNGTQSPSQPQLLMKKPDDAGDNHKFTSLTAATHPEGGAWFVSILSDIQSDSSNNFIVAVRVDHSGNVLTSPLVHKLPLVPNIQHISTAVNEFGNALVVFDIGAELSGPDNAIQGLLLDADGSTSGKVIEINSSPKGQKLRPSVAWITGVGWWTVWQGPDDDGSGILGRLFNPTLTPKTGDIAINLTTQHEQTDPFTVSLGDSRIIVAWRGGPGANSLLNFRLLDAKAVSELPL